VPEGFFDEFDKSTQKYNAYQNEFHGDIDKVISHQGVILKRIVKNGKNMRKHHHHVKHKHVSSESSMSSKSSFENEDDWFHMSDEIKG
jgi:hypothetical protein